MPRLYAADPEEALAVLESLDTLEYMKAFALLGTVRETPGLSRQQKLDLLGSGHAAPSEPRPNPDERVFRLSRVAMRLFELGKTEEARKIVEIVAPTAKQLSPKTNAAACATAGEAIESLRPAGRIATHLFVPADAGDEYYWMPALFHVAYRIATQQPAEAERIAAEAIDFATRSCPAYYRKEYRSRSNRERVGEHASRGTRIDSSRSVTIWFRSMPLGRSGWRRRSATLTCGRMPWE